MRRRIGERNLIHGGIGVALLCASVVYQTEAAVYTITSRSKAEAAVAVAQDGDVLQFEEGTYGSISYVPQADITVLGMPFERSGDPADIEKVQFHFQSRAGDGWRPQGKFKMRGVQMVHGGTKIVAKDEIVIEHCIFWAGSYWNDNEYHIEFVDGGYGEISNCEFHNSFDDGIVIRSGTSANNTSISIHDNYFDRIYDNAIVIDNRSAMRYEIYNNHRRR